MVLGSTMGIKNGLYGGRSLAAARNSPQFSVVRPSSARHKPLRGIEFSRQSRGFPQISPWPNEIRSSSIDPRKDG